MNYPYLFFDADNTLFDFDRAQTWALEQALTELSGTFDPAWLEQYAAVNLRFWEAFERREISMQQLKQERFKAFLQEAAIEIDPQLTNQLYLERLAQCTFLLEGAERLIDKLASDGHTMILVTNGLRVVQRPRFAATPMTKRFKSFVISGEVGVAKPAVKIFEIAMDAVGNPAKKDVLMIGDSLTSDIQGGVNFGIDTCWFNPAKAERKMELNINFEIEKLEELESIV